MAGTRLRIEIEDREVKAAFARVSRAGRDMTALMDEVGAALVLSTQRRFETESAPGGSPWPPSIRARVEGGQTLTDQGRLRDSITHRAGPENVEVGTNVVYAAIHQFGGTISAKAGGYLKFPLPGGGFVQTASVEIPARPFLGVDAADRAEIRALAGDYLRAAWRPGAAA